LGACGVKEAVERLERFEWRRYSRLRITVTPATNTITKGGPHASSAITIPPRQSFPSKKRLPESMKIQ
jgi:hypothetical protein